jgi:hypothetical protein
MKEQYIIAQDEEQLLKMADKEHALDYAEQVHEEKPEAITTVRDTTGKLWALLTLKSIPEIKAQLAKGANVMHPAAAA